MSSNARKLSLLRCWRTPPSSALIDQGHPTGTVTPEDVRQASEDAAVEPRHLKALLVHLSGLGISVTLDAADRAPSRRPRTRKTTTTTAAAKKAPAKKAAGQEGRRRRRPPRPRRPRRAKTPPRRRGEEGRRQEGRRPRRPPRTPTPAVVGRPRRQEDPAGHPGRAVREGRRGRPDDQGGREEGAFVVSAADETDEPEQQVMVAGATADPVKDYLKQIGKVPAPQRRDGGRARQADRGRPVLRGEARQGRQDLRRSCSRSSSGSPRTAAAPRTTCSRPTSASSSRWPSATPAAACSSST